MLEKERLEKLYKSGLSQQEIANKTGWSYKQVIYWMQRYGIPRRLRSEAMYKKYNPNGDPFKIKKLKTSSDIALFNLGLGLFLGEGTKRNKYSLVLANTDPRIIRVFLKFLKEICGVGDIKIKAALNLFDDIDHKSAMDFWTNATKIPPSQFNKPTIRKSRGGSYKNRSQVGTLTITVSNMKLKGLMDKWCEDNLIQFSKIRTL